jgi:hypothetical protein
MIKRGCRAFRGIEMIFTDVGCDANRPSGRWTSTGAFGTMASLASRASVAVRPCWLKFDLTPK